MRAFRSGTYLLSDARVEVRLVYTGFLILTLIGMLSVAAFQLLHVGPTPGNVAVHYRGGERDGAMAFAKSFRELVELTHFHAFMMGMVYLVLAHLLVATTAPEWVKRSAIAVGFAGVGGDLVGAWLVTYLSAGFAYLVVAAWAAQWLGFGAFFYYPMREMWFATQDGLDTP